MKNCFFVLLFCAYGMRSFSQDSNSSGSFSISANFSAVPSMKINGTDTGYQNALSLAPALNYRGKSGWGLSYAPALLLSGAHPGIYMHTVSGGYEQYGKKNFDLAFNYSHFFFSANSSVPSTPIHNELYVYMAYTKTWLQPTISGSIGFGRNTGQTSSPAFDIGLVGGFGHDFSFDDKGPFTSIDLTPSILVNAGTNEYFSFLSASKYISHTKKFGSYVKKGGKGNASSSAQSLAVRNLELDLESSFEFGSFSIEPSGSLYMPLPGPGSVDGYWQLNLRYHF
jgi:hypothetical protein